MMRRDPAPSTDCVFKEFTGPRNAFFAVISGTDTHTVQGVYPLSEGAIFPKDTDEEHVALTVHDHAEVITCNPHKVKDVIDAADGNLKTALEATAYYGGFVKNCLGFIHSSLWVVLYAKDGEIHKLPLVDPSEANLNALKGLNNEGVVGVFHIGTLKQLYDPRSDDTWTVTFSPLMYL